MEMVIDFAGSARVDAHFEKFTQEPQRFLITAAAIKAPACQEN
jgi:hypothetical protein